VIAVCVNDLNPRSRNLECLCTHGLFVHKRGPCSRCDCLSFTEKLAVKTEGKQKTRRLHMDAAA
jgi:hypothetical protein